MQIDWLTFAAQIINFLILVWLLKRFLYQPVMNAMEEREKMIEERFSQALTARNDAETQSAWLRNKQEELEMSRDEILNQARKEADELRDRLHNDVSNEMEDKRARWDKQLNMEHDDLMRSVQRHAGQELLKITGRLLVDFANSDMASEVAKVFTRQLQKLDKGTRTKLVTAATRTDDPALVESPIALPSAVRSQITHAIHQCLETEIDVQYRESEDIILGIRLTIAEQTVERSAARYLKTLESTLDEVLETERLQQAVASN